MTAGTKVRVMSSGDSAEVKAGELSGKTNLLFRRNSLTGAVEVMPRDGQGVDLNSDLHS